MSYINEKFSVLMAVYYRDSPDFLEHSLLSIYQNDTPPTEVIIVRDGPVTNEIGLVIEKWESLLPIIYVSLEENMGLGVALNYGLTFCHYDIVIRADSDDVNRYNRFSVIMDFMAKNPDVDIVSSWIEEFQYIPGDSGLVKKVPSKSDIIKYSRTRSPFNHPAVAFRKEKISHVGGYGNEYLYEDYALWLKLLSKGYIGDNIQDVLVDMRFSIETTKRRGGWKYAISEIKAQYHFYNNNYITFCDFLRNVFLRSTVRILPANIRGFIYKKIIRGIL